MFEGGDLETGIPPEWWNYMDKHKEDIGDVSKEIESLVNLHDAMRSSPRIDMWIKGQEEKLRLARRERQKMRLTMFQSAMRVTKRRGSKVLLRLGWWLGSDGRRQAQGNVRGDGDSGVFVGFGAMILWLLRNGHDEAKVSGLVEGMGKLLKAHGVVVVKIEVLMQELERAVEEVSEGNGVNEPAVKANDTPDGAGGVDTDEPETEGGNGGGGSGVGNPGSGSDGGKEETETGPLEPNPAVPEPDSSGSDDDGESLVPGVEREPEAVEDDSSGGGDDVGEKVAMGEKTDTGAKMRNAVFGLLMSRESVRGRIVAGGEGIPQAMAKDPEKEDGE